MSGDGSRLMRICHPTAAILDKPGGARLRELLLGAEFLVQKTRAAHSYGSAARDGYAGWVANACLAAPGPAPTHYVAAIRTYAKQLPELKDTGPITSLPFASQLSVSGQSGAWAEILLNGAAGFVPARHLRAMGETFSDRMAVAEMFLGTPYLWGGNSAFGLDCSGLVQAALLACGIPCPGDSDQQQQALGEDIPEGEAMRRGDLIFWKGHVALCVDSARLIHANAHDMAVAHEGIEAAISRIKAKGEGPVTARKRL